MDKLFNLSLDTAINVVLSCLGIYITVILLTRIFGKRSFSKMSSFDFAMTVAVGSLIASTVLTSSVSLAEGMLALLAVYSLQLTAAFFRRYPWFSKAIDNTPLLLMEKSHIYHDNLKKARVTEGDIRSKLREANVTSFENVQAVIFETTGDISVIHSDKIDNNLLAYVLGDVDR